MSQTPETSLFSPENIETTVRRSTQEELKSLLLDRLKSHTDEQITMKQNEMLVSLNDENLKQKIREAFILAKSEIVSLRKKELQAAKPTGILEDTAKLGGKTMEALGGTVKKIPILGEYIKNVDDTKVGILTGLIAGVGAFFAFRRKDKTDKKEEKEKKGEESPGFFGTLWKWTKYIGLGALGVFGGKMAIDILAEKFPNNQTLGNIKKGIDGTIDKAKEIGNGVVSGIKKIGEAVDWIGDNKIAIGGTLGAVIFRNQIGAVLKAPGQFMEMVKAGRLLRVAEIEKGILKSARPSMLRRVGRVGVGAAVVFGAGVVYEYFQDKDKEEALKKELADLNDRLNKNHERSNIHVLGTDKASQVNTLIADILKNKKSLDASDWQNICDEVKDFTYQVRLPEDRDGFEEYVVKNGVISEIRYVEESGKARAFQANYEIK